jgi:uncharacterized protein YndB with AHSA1/START domain
MTTMTRIDRGSTPTTQIYQEGTDLVFERTFDAPRELVWRAFMEPARVARWWGRRGSNTTVAEMDVRPGGHWRYLTQGSAGNDVEFFGEYLEIDPPKKFTWTFLFDVDGLGVQGGPETHTFEDLGGRTRVTSRGNFGSTEAIEGALAIGMREGAIELWDRLAEELARG